MTHVPVLLAELLRELHPVDGALYVDATFGRGGVTAALLEAADCRVIAVDCDPDAEPVAGLFAKRYSGRFDFLRGRFGQLVASLETRGVRVVTGGIVFDLGVSSPQLEDAGRGFSFRRDGPLDMRMDRTGTTAADLVNTLGETELAGVLRTLGEERYARRVAHAIIAARPIARTAELAAVVRAAVPSRQQTIDAATRTFQALRIAVNDELGELRAALEAAEYLLAEGAVLAVVSFHSLEDRLVKRFLRERAGRAPRGPRHLPTPDALRQPTFRLPATGLTRPDPAERGRNPRARSARLRAAVRTAAPAALRRAA